MRLCSTQHSRLALQSYTVTSRSKVRGMLSVSFFMGLTCCVALVLQKRFYISYSHNVCIVLLGIKRYFHSIKVIIGVVCYKHLLRYNLYSQGCILTSLGLVHAGYLFCNLHSLNIN